VFAESFWLKELAGKDNANNMAITVCKKNLIKYISGLFASVCGLPKNYASGNLKDILDLNASGVFRH